MTDVLGTPTSPPASPVIPVGIGTYLGVSSTVLAAVIGGVQAMLGGDHTLGTIMAFAFAALTLVTTLAGRFAQAYAKLRDAPASLRDDMVLAEVRRMLESAAPMVGRPADLDDGAAHVASDGIAADKLDGPAVEGL